MKMTLTKQDLQNETARNMLVKIISNAKHGGFMVVHSLKTKTGHGETSDYVYGKGISYPKAVAKSLEMLQTIQEDSSFAIEVTRGTWQDKQGNITPTNRKSAAFPVHAIVTKTYKHGDEAFEQALINIGLSLVTPQEPTKDYKSLGNGIYEDETGTLYLRDLRLVSKTVIVKGNYPLSASKEETAVADTIKRMMPIGNYRMFRLDADYASINLDGMELAMEGEVEQVKENIEANTELVPA